MHRKLGLALLAALSLADSASSQDSGHDQLSASPIFEREIVTGEWLGARLLLEDRGVSLFGSYTAEV
jgi:carbohydrate-selective porin OprB